MPINNMLFALLLTITVECLTAFVLGYRKKFQIIIISLANVITNPALNYILMLLRLIGHNVSFYLLIPLEITVIFVEWRIMVYSFRTEPKKILILSAVMNCVSCVTGILILGLR